MTLKRHQRARSKNDYENINDPKKDINGILLGLVTQKIHNIISVIALWKNIKVENMSKKKIKIHYPNRLVMVKRNKMIPQLSLLFLLSHCSSVEILWLE